MADGIYVGMSGAVARAEQLESVADNLANAQTVGFKAARPTFEAVLAEGGQQELAYAAAVSTGVDLRPGATLMTGQPTDVLIEDGAFLAVEQQGGQVAYSRDGRLTADAQGTLRTGAGVVLGADGRPVVVPPGVPFTLDSRGAVYSAGVEVGRLGLYKLSGPMERSGEGALSPGARGVAEPVEARVRTGELELSNASPLESAVQMITAQRNFDTSMQAIQTYRQMDGRANELGRMK